MKKYSIKEIMTKIKSAWHNPKFIGRQFTPELVQEILEEKP